VSAGPAGAVLSTGARESSTARGTGKRLLPPDPRGAVERQPAVPSVEPGRSDVSRRLSRGPGHRILHPWAGRRRAPRRVLARSLCPQCARADSTHLGDRRRRGARERRSRRLVYPPTLSRRERSPGLPRRREKSGGPDFPERWRGCLAVRRAPAQPPQVEQSRRRRPRPAATVQPNALHSAAIQEQAGIALQATHAAWRQAEEVTDLDQADQLSLVGGGARRVSHGEPSRARIYTLAGWQGWQIW